MKKKDEKNGKVPLKEQPKQVNGEENVVEVKQSELSKLFEELIAVIQGFIQTNGEKMNFSSFDDIELNSKMIDAIEFFMTFFNTKLIDLLKNDNNRLKQQLENLNQTKGKRRKSIEQIQDQTPEIKATINGGVMEFAKIFGNIFEHLINKEGNRLIEVDNESLAKILASNFKLIDGSILNIKSLAIYIGQGRKMESIINLSVLKELFKKKD